MSFDLTKELLEVSHTAEDYLPWVNGLIEKIKKDSEGLEQIRLTKGLTKQLMCEALPVGLLANNYFNASKNIWLQLIVGNQGYDAIVSDSPSFDYVAYYVEVTMAHEGEEEYLRNKILYDKGDVSRFSKVSKTGTRKTGLCLSVDSSMVSESDVLTLESGLISDAIKRKKPKTYPPNTLLVIGFDDRVAFDRPENIQSIKSILDKEQVSLQKYSAIVVVGLYENLIIFSGADSQ